MKKKMIFTVMLVVLTTIVCLAVIEAGVRLLLPANPFDARLYLHPYINKVNRVSLAGVSPVNRFTTNKWGLRGSNPPRDWNGYRTVITVGGSTTQCYYLDDSNTWPALLEQMLRRSYPKLWVGNGGIDGHSTRGHIIFMDRVIRKTKPTLVILLTGVNDLGYSLENTGQRFSHFERFSFKYWAFEHSRLLQLLNVWKQILFNKAIVVDHAASGTYLPQPLGRETPLPLNLRDALPSLAEYDRNIQQIIDIGNALGVRMLFMTQPMLYSEEPYWRDKLGIMYWVHDSGVRYSAATYWKMLALFNGDLITICRNNGVPCYDLAAVVPHSDRYFYDIVHFNDNGARLVAQKTAEFILSNHLLER